MEQLVVVAYPEPLIIEARRITHDGVPEGNIALGYYHDETMIARSVVEPDAVDAIHTILTTPVSVALAANEDDGGNIDGRVCLMLPIDPEQFGQDADKPDEPWKASVPAPPAEVEQGYGSTGGDDQSHIALFPIGNVVRASSDRNHPDSVADDAREMLQNLLDGRAVDAVSKAIDDLLSSI